jgi:hypothetical protein
MARPSRRAQARLRHLVAATSSQPSGADQEEVVATAALRLQERIRALQDQQDQLQLELGAIRQPQPAQPTDEPSMAAALAFFRTNGYWVIPDAVDGPWLARVQAAFTKAQAPARALWQAARDAREREGYSAGNTGTTVSEGEEHLVDLGEVALGEELAGRHANGYFDVPRFAEQDDALLRLLDNPKVVPIVEAALGGQACITQIQARTVPAEVAHQYTSWHRDAGDHIPVHPDFSPWCKAFTFFFDVLEDGGCAAVVPGSVSVTRPPLPLRVIYCAHLLRFFVGCSIVYSARATRTGQLRWTKRRSVLTAGHIPPILPLSSFPARPAPL